jgi:hypothetical protein
MNSNSATFSKWHGGKGCQPRKVDSQKYSDNFDKIFAKKSQVIDIPQKKS